MTDSHKKLCSQNKGYAKIWDQKYGVTDNSVIPDSVKALILESPKVRRATRIPPAKKVRVKRQPTPKARGLGDLVESALTNVGITSEKVESWLGRPCGCSERKKKLNALGEWAKRIALGKIENAKEHLEELTGESL